LVCAPRVRIWSTAQLYLHLTHWYIAQALDLAPHHVKAIFRKGQALVLLANHDAALTEYQKALQLAPADAAIKAAIEALQKKMKQEEHEVIIQPERISAVPLNAAHSSCCILSCLQAAAQSSFRGIFNR